ncbi:MAG: PDZ domain-containing protein [Terriglobales bacterium]
MNLSVNQNAVLCQLIRRVVPVVVFCLLATQLPAQWDVDDYVTGMTVVGRPNADRGCPPIVWKIEPDTPAMKAGIQPGDRLLGIDGHRNLDIVQAGPFLRTKEQRLSVIELEGKNGPYKVEVGRIKASELYAKEGLKLGPDGVFFPADATEAEIQRVGKIHSEPPHDKKVFNVGHYPSDMNLYYPGFEVFVWDEPQPPLVGGIEDGPAKRAGVHYGDPIVSVNDINPRGKSMAKLERLFSSETAANMKLVVDRDGVLKVISFPLEKAVDVAAENNRRRFDGRMIPSGVPDAYLHCWTAPKKP